MPGINDSVTREARRKEAEARSTAIAALTPKQRIAELDKRLGKGKGAVKERARLAKADA